MMNTNKKEYKEGICSQAFFSVTLKGIHSYIYNFTIRLYSHEAMKENSIENKEIPEFQSFVCGYQYNNLYTH